MKSFLVFLPLLFSATLLTYFVKLAPTVYSGDSGDLITAAYFLGIPHPPGYPLYTLIAHLFTLIPVNSVAWRVNLVSTVFQAATTPIVFLIIYRLTKKIIPAIFGSSLLAFSFTFWFYSEIAEVFALNNFFASLLILLALLFRQTKKPIYIYSLFFLLGLSIIHHQTTVLIFPAIFILIFDPLKSFLKDYKKAVISLFLFILGFLPLLYFLFVANFASPVFWDEPNSLSSVIRLITRADYGTFQSSRIVAEPAGGRIVHFLAYFRIFLADFTILGAILIILGIVASFVRDKALGLFLLAGLAISGPIFLMYSNFPQGDAFEISVIERFTMLPSIFAVIAMSLAISAVSFLKFLPKIQEKAKKTVILLIPIVFLVLPAVLFLENWQKIDLSKNYLGKTLAEDILVSVPKDALVLLRGDTIVFNTQYIHFAESFRPDLKVVSVGVLVTDWYYPNQIQRIYPELSAPKVEASKRLSGFVASNFENHDVFQFGPQFAVSGFTWVPYGLGAKLYRDGQLPPSDEIFKQNLQLWQNLKIPKKSGFADVLFDFSRKIYTEAAFRTATYFFDQQSLDRALVFYTKSLEIDPSYLLARQMLGKTLAKLGNCQLAKTEFEKSLKLTPQDAGVYQDLSELYKDCFKNENLATAFFQMSKEARAKSLNLPSLEEF